MSREECPKNLSTNLAQEPNVTQNAAVNTSSLAVNPFPYDAGIVRPARARVRNSATRWTTSLVTRSAGSGSLIRKLMVPFQVR